MKLQVFMRNDLNMRKGKMVAQASHAVMKRVLDLCVITPEAVILSSQGYETLKSFVEKPDLSLVLVANEQSLLDATSRNINGRIVDSGRTEFHGVPTLTCGAIGLHEQRRVFELVVPDDVPRELIARQWFVIAKPAAGAPMSKVDAMAAGCVATVAHLLSLFSPCENGHSIPFADYPAMKDWIMGAFGKVALSAPCAESLVDVRAAVEGEGAHVSLTEHMGLKVMVVGPEYPAGVQSLAELRLL